MFRLRRQADRANYEKQVKHLESTVEQMASAFLNFSDDALQSPSFAGDHNLVILMQTIVQRILSLAQAVDIPSPEAEHSAESRSAPTISGEWELFKAAMASYDEIPSSGSKYSSTRHIPGVYSPPALAALEESASPIPCHMESSASSAITNVFGDGLMHIPPIDFDCSRLDSNISRCYPSPNSLSVHIVRASLHRGYESLFDASDSAASSTVPKFAFPLSFRSREEILMILRWYLRPGSLDMARLAVAHFDTELLTQYNKQAEHSPVLATNNPCHEEIQARAKSGFAHRGSCLMNAYQVEQWLQETKLRYIDDDLIELSIKPSGGWLWPSDPMDPPGSGSSGFGSSFAANYFLWPIHSSPPPSSWTSVGLNSNDHTAARIVRLSISRLIALLTDISFCLERGPAYGKGSLAKAIATASVTG